MRWAGVLALTAVLTGCADEVTPDPLPTSYAIGPADLWREVPIDICRRAHPEFLENLTQRVINNLPQATRASFRFHDFNVTDGNEQGREAVLRFTLTADGAADVLHYARGPFNPKDCSIGPMLTASGAAQSADPRAKEVRIP